MRNSSEWEINLYQFNGWFGDNECRLLKRTSGITLLMTGHTAEGRREKCMFFLIRYAYTYICACICKHMYTNTYIYPSVSLQLGNVSRNVPKQNKIVEQTNWLNFLVPSQYMALKSLLKNSGTVLTSISCTRKLLNWHACSGKFSVYAVQN